MKKKGFTLIELLAVLVVLAILALITIPLVIGIIKNARVKSHKRSVEAYARSVENAVGVYLLTNTKTDYSMIGSLYNKDNQKIDSINIEYTGQPVTCNSLTVSNIGLITLKGCQVASSDKMYKYENKKITEEIYKEYSIGDTFTINGDSYHIIANSPKNQDYVVALKYLPLTVAEVNASGYSANYNSGNGNIGGSGFYYSATCSSNDRSGCTTAYEQSKVKNIVDSWAVSKFQNNELEEVDGYKARLMKTEDFTNNLGYTYRRNYFSSSNNGETPNWVLGWATYSNGSDNYSYWTMSGVDESSSEVWCLDGYTSRLSKNNVLYATIAIRPVINVYKDKLPE